MLNIPIAAILTKMEEQLRQAKTAASQQRLREHIAAVRALCDLVLEKEEAKETAAVSSAAVVPLSIPQGKSERIDIGDDANGPSLFDF
ncbi:YwdI family protein [Parageobacillus thermoglucosidasius]|uniref:YwdI family protein n=3 Tax=Anoxybacillaceae TaxID=3120669 RepID=A0AAN0YMA0_PARTM|nr:YwdI family protein [Parageobacillus thermoglucosidasius]ALF09157.1 hypothetical protein AOT13_03465 [Parageobacillus thermoglucosidasius]ANZ29239.1 hypothetical protein BCV53_03480 [Parageobacillus thermoglucosidasius]APM79977.1 hypothetical protein BCV54_03485 [Parageobacillus thermoglucosidasius]KJX70011.1 hypothetical protein WH82_04240 [Parageobacillus thermoglucosidasius]MBY6266689.1 hypothetical protein [Parageobacillus thermoglucosidasius]